MHMDGVLPEGRGRVGTPLPVAEGPGGGFWGFFWSLLDEHIDLPQPALQRVKRQCP